MKKNFFKKKLASALALALVVASVSPSPLSASAATVAKIVDKGSSKATAVLYVDKVSYGKSAVNFDLSKTYAGTKYTWTISDSKKATIGAKTGYVVAKAPGVVTVKVAAKNKKGKTTAFTQKVTIRKRATAVAAGDDFTLNSGETKTIKATVTPSNSTDAVRYYSSDEKIATVDVKTGVVTAIGAGEATITAYAKAASTAPNTSQWNVTDTVKVTVPVGLASVKQNSSTELAATFNTNIESGKVTASDFSIVNDATKQVIAVKEAKADGTGVVKLTTFSNMSDGKTYTVTYNKKSVQFTATDGVVASLAITPATVAANTETEIKVNTVDSKGIVINSYALGSVTDSKLEFSISDNKGYTSGSKLTLFNIGDTAKATAIYHTYKWDNTTGQETGAIKAELTITAVDKVAAGVSKTEYTIGANKPNWNKYTSKTSIAVGESSTLWFRVTKTDDSYAKYGDYTFSSSNSNVLIVSDHSSELAARINAVSVGSAYVLVKDKNGNVVWSLAVTVVGERKATNMILDKDSVTVSNSSNITDTKVITTTLKDQYGEDMDYTSAPTKTLLTSIASGVVQPSVVPSADGDITITAVGATKGTYQYKIVYGNAFRTITVNVVAPDNSTSATVSYQLDKSADTIDTVFTGNSTTPKDFVAKVAMLKGGVVDGYADITSYSIKKGTTEVASGSSLKNTTAVSYSALSVSGSTVTKAVADGYSVNIKYVDNKGVTQEMNTGFVIKDTQSSVTATQVKTKVTGTSSVANAISEAFKFYYEGNEITSPIFQTIDKDATVTASSGTNYTFVRSVYVYVTVTGTKGSFQVPVKVTLGTSGVTIEH
ncbi:Ig-like domain (group 2) [Anaerocolumna jejuensis DSM 15929]|uniref:Ig-like domain (Group 2) n=1 Tax=Anaerocolumna jejuensis DSM 15929 TaxID=1121322 RepID=A0A1M6UH19_9FIRM|nr:Ig-like domain-containing protein [Anaerocolumna jejuensis]SHK68469.1 Ig-like domain (group 2) [Anaerocolumna jejuensis DSM 15929]